MKSLCITHHTIISLSLSGVKFDNCNCDGYVSSIYTLAIGAVSHSGSFPWYGERCASTLAVAFSSDNWKEPKVFTTTLHGECAFNHTGTSAAAPIAAGVIALLLESNPNLSYRDVKHLLVYTTSVDQLTQHRGWRMNAAGFLYNSRFGFGLIDAEALLVASNGWKNVPPLVTCPERSDLRWVILRQVILPPSLTSLLTSCKWFLFSLFQNRLPYHYRQQDTVILISSDGCENSGYGHEVNSLEYVSVKLTIKTRIRGKLEIYLTSPSGEMSIHCFGFVRNCVSYRHDVNVTLEAQTRWRQNVWWVEIHECSFLGRRTRRHLETFNSWQSEYMSYVYLTIDSLCASFLQSLYPGGPRGVISEIVLLLHGTKQVPEHLKKPRKYPLYIDMPKLIDYSMVSQSRMKSCLDQMVNR